MFFLAPALSGAAEKCIDHVYNNIDVNASKSEENAKQDRYGGDTLGGSDWPSAHLPIRSASQLLISCSLLFLLS
jgi:hypothetical protein